MAQPLKGSWDGFVSYDDYKIPFPIEFSQKGDDVTASFFNGDDRVTSTAGRLAGEALTVNFDHYATPLTATLKDGIIHGIYGTCLSKGVPDIAGLWDIPTESPKGEHAWRLIVRQSGGRVSAAILRVDGDTGALEGTYADGKFLLHHFDGARLGHGDHAAANWISGCGSQGRPQPGQALQCHQTGRSESPRITGADRSGRPYPREKRRPSATPMPASKTRW